MMIQRQLILLVLVTFLLLLHFVTQSNEIVTTYIRSNIVTVFIQIFFGDDCIATIKNCLIFVTIFILLRKFKH